MTRSKSQDERRRSVIAIVGQTASGKSALAVKLAKKFKGEIISADSRQVYRGLNIGSGKITQNEMRGVPHYLLDIANPKKIFTVADYQREAKKKIDLIIRKGKLPIICGGTGFYIKTLINNVSLPAVSPNPKLRAKLEKLPIEKLAQELKSIDPRRFSNIDQHNRPRLIRAIEIATKLGKVPSLDTKDRPWTSLQIGTRLDPEKLRQNIHQRLVRRLRAGLISEVKDLHKKGLSWQRLDDLGLEYRYVSRYLRQQMRREEMLEELELAIWHYAKRQLTWFKKNKSIHWVENYSEAEKQCSRFLKNQVR